MQTLGIALGLVGAALMLASYMMKSMLPLRIAALAACVCLVLYGWIFAAIPTLVLYGALIPINIKKTIQIRRVVKAIENARSDAPVAEWLLPHMTRREAKAGDVLWRKGDAAGEMIYVETGRLRLVEHGEEIGPDVLVGEIGLFAPDNRRTLSVECATDCTLYSLSSEAMLQLYFQSPKLGYHVMRLIVARLLHDADVERAAARQGAQHA
ncbi:MAG: cyclic nucleotide-binding domain-containing protein [Rubrivivax sp.]|nr:cyclic nucleotide-binding domain-containing protein [Rubrivivax sp.]